MDWIESVALLLGGLGVILLLWAAVLTVFKL